MLHEENVTRTMSEADQGLTAPAPASAGEGSDLLFWKAAGVAWIAFDNPARHNALTPGMEAALDRIGPQLNADDEVRVVVVRGWGETAFMSGADITQIAAWGGEGARARHAKGAALGLIELHKPLIAMIHGWCLGAGIVHALAADIRVASTDARFGIPAARLGIGYPLDAVQTLVEVVGPANASQLLLSGERIDAAEALRIGLVNRVVPGPELEPAVSALAMTLAGNAPLSMRSTKTSIRAVRAGAGPQAAADARRLIAACRASRDHAEGRQAFAEKRSPRFTGR